MVAADSGLTRLLDGLRPSELVLRDWVASQLDSSMVDEIAAADYGFGVAEYRDAVAELRLVSRLPSELIGHPAAEVLALTRWSTVDSSELGPEETRRRHVMRLFCCTLLVSASTSDGRPVDSLMPLVESAIALGPAASEAARGFLAWCRLNEPGDWRDDVASRPFLTLALVALSSDPATVPGLIAAFADELHDALDDEGLLWSQRPIRDLLKLTAMSEARRMWVPLADRWLTAGDPRLAILGQAMRGDLTADAEELRSLLRQA